jgi:enterobactin synthetase component D
LDAGADMSVSIKKTANDISPDTQDFLQVSRLETFAHIASLVVYRVDFDLQNFHQDFFQLFNIPFPAQLQKAVPKRQAEFLAGRLAANRTLAAIGVLVSEIPTGEHRSPIWPKAVVASITHNESTALCAAAFKAKNNDAGLKYLGLDLENILPIATIEEIKGMIINPDEAIILRQSALDFTTAFTLAFSAKESLFKALYPNVGYYFDFDAACIESIDHKRQRFQLVLSKNLNAAFSQGQRFEGYYQADSKSILTLIAD